MIALHGDLKILVATRPIDFRRGVNGLVALVAEALKSDPYSGTIFVFRSKRNDRLKMLTYDGSGIVLVTKWLEAGRFTWPPIQDGAMRLTENAGPKRRRALGLEPLSPCAPLVGLVRHAEAGKLSPVSQKRRGSVYRYYVSTATLRGDRTLRPFRTSAAPLEALVRERLQAHGVIPANAGADDWAEVRTKLLSVEINEHDIRITST